MTLYSSIYFIEIFYNILSVPYFIQFYCIYFIKALLLSVIISSLLIPVGGYHYFQCQFSSHYIYTYWFSRLFNCRIKIDTINITWFRGSSDIYMLSHTFCSLIRNCFSSEQHKRWRKRWHLKYIFWLAKDDKFFFVIFGKTSFKQVWRYKTLANNQDRFQLPCIAKALKEMLGY